MEVPGARSHYKLVAGKEALVSVVYRVTQECPRDEIFGLTSQLRRAAVSVPSNIEGAARNGSKEFEQFLNIAIGSISEIETQLLMAVDLGYLAEDASVFALLEQVSKLVNGLWKSVRP